MFKKSVLAVALATSLLGSSCLGSFPAFNNLRNWNAEVVEADWLAEIIFLGLNIIPVYPIASLGDILIFNTIEYWGGDTPFGEPDAFPKAEFGNN